MNAYHSSKQKLTDLCRKHGANITNSGIYNECAVFLFYTSWFEELLFNYDNRQCPENTEKICRELSKLIDVSKFNAFGMYFADRYIQENNSVTSHFNNLKLKSKNVEKVKGALINFKISKKENPDLFFAYVMIVYRFRNNMFHGSKGLINLGNYTEQFKVINHFMYALIDEIYKTKYKGFND